MVGKIPTGEFTWFTMELLLYEALFLATQLCCSIIVKILVINNYPSLFITAIITTVCAMAV